MKIALMLCLLFLFQNSRGENFRTVIPYENVAGKIIVKAKIGDEEGRFLFDTGAPVCLTDQMAQKLGLQKSGEIKTEDSNGQRSTQKVTDLPRLTLGEVGFTSLQALIFPADNPIGTFGIDGIIGYSLFGNAVVQINAREKTITITDDPSGLDLDPICAHSMIPNQQHLPVFNIHLGGNEIDRVMFDCGAAGFYDLSESSFQELKNTPAFETVSKGHGILSLGAAGLEQKSEKYRVRIPELSMGTGRFSNVIAITTNAGLSRIGSGILNYGKVTIDYKNELFYYQPYSTETVRLDQKDWNVIITVMNNELVAGFIWSSMQSQLEGGEKIVEVNRKRFDKVDPYQAMTTNLINLFGDTAEIVILDKNGLEKKLTIHRE